MFIIEKLLLLKSISLFKAIPDDLLLEVANTVAHEKRLKANEIILKKGVVNSSIYIIAAGQVRVHDEHDHLIKELVPREIFGELSALTGKPTVSFVSSINECLLLTISNDALYDLMRMELGISKGIIHALCERTQNMSFQIQELLN